MRGAVAQFHVWVMLGTTVLLVLCALSGWRITRAEGVVLVLVYAAYVTVSLR